MTRSRVRSAAPTSGSRSGETKGEARLDLPVELRNDIARVEILRGENAGAVNLLDERFQRRTVGLVSGGSADNAQPLLSPLYYIRRALGPFAQVREASTANVAEALPELIEGGVSAIVLADIGTLPEETQTALRNLDRGGRHADPLRRSRASPPRRTTPSCRPACAAAAASSAAR